jgi:hypothetical protein
MYLMAALCTLLLATGASVSSEFSPSCWENLLAINQALYISILLSTTCLILWINLEVTVIAQFVFMVIGQKIKG